MGKASGILSARSALGAAVGELETLVVARGDLLVSEEALLPVFSLRVSRKSGTTLAETFAHSRGLRLPSAWGTVVGDSRRSVAWIEPTGWWLLGPDANANAVADAASLPKGVYVTDLTARFCVLRISGASSRRLLSSSISLDLSDAAFPDGTCARTKFADIGGVFLQRLGAEYRIAMDVGFGHCLLDWIRDAAAHIPLPCDPATVSAA